MTAPIGGDIGERFETMRDTMVYLLLVRVCLVVCLADALGNNLGITLAVASVLAIGALHASGIFEKVTAQSTTHNVIKLLRDKLVSLLLVNLFLLPTDSSLTVQTNVERPSVLQLFGYASC